MPNDLTVAKRPLAHLPAERRDEIASILLAGYNDGKQVAEMAPQFGISDVTAYALLLREHEEDWKEAQKARAIAKRESASHELNTLKLEARSASDALSLARVREQIRIAEANDRSAQWELERVYRRIYGQDQVHVAAPVQINISLRRDKAPQQSIDIEDAS